MKKIIFTFFFLAFLTHVSAQIKVNSSGDVYASKNFYLGSSSSNFLGTDGNFPIIFKVNNILAGFTGNNAQGNVSFGYGSLLNQSAGTYNTAIGSSALYSNATTGNYNTAIGSNALYYNTSGSVNTAIGSCALYLNTTGSYNTADGCNALINNTEGNYNSALGHCALQYNTTGNYNTAIGFYAGGSSPNNVTNTTAIGYAAYATASDQVRIGNSSIISIGGNVNWTNLSDGRAKRNIRQDVPGLDFINLLQPITYNLDLDAIDELLKSDDPKINAFRDSINNARSPEEKEIEAKSRANKEKQVYSGFIAQDVEIIAKSIGYDFSGVDAPENGKGAYGLRYADFVVPLVKAIQELSEQNELLQQQINELKGNSYDFRSSTNETETTGIVNPVIAQCKLYQNAPNPFSEHTLIRFFISEVASSAQLCIYDLQGKQIKQILLTQRGEASQTISGSELQAGMYLYSLIVNGIEVATKRMILTK